MQEKQTVYIETYGDVSVLGNLFDSKQIESKLYKRPLNDSDKNVWKSIYNWTREDFPVDTFSSLILLTTQKVPIGSAWLHWNEKIHLKGWMSLEISNRVLTHEKEKIRF